MNQQRKDIDLRALIGLEDVALNVDDVAHDAICRMSEGIEREGYEGTVVQVMGPVVDVAFKGELPALNNLLRAGHRKRGIPLEAVQLLGEGIVRTVALDSTDGMPRGERVFDTYAPISVPVGPGVRG
ncbi:MAG: hypothetical protein OEV43_09355, partial [Coriobacteriia bacterium]|nr:hypothetical protein [Coriobacteriia bacterium]